VYPSVFLKSQMCIKCSWVWLNAHGGHKRYGQGDTISRNFHTSNCRHNLKSMQFHDSAIRMFHLTWFTVSVGMLVIMCAHCVPANYLRYIQHYYKYINPVPTTHYMKNLEKAPALILKLGNDPAVLNPTRKDSILLV